MKAAGTSRTGRALPARQPGDAKVDRITVHSVLNNNVVVTIDPAGRERVLTGRGLGFKAKPGDEVDPARVEKTFVLRAGEPGRGERDLLQESPYEVIVAATSGVEAAERTMQRSLGRELVIAVIDHLLFLLQRLDQGITPLAPVAPELGVLHPDEFRAGEEILHAISESLGRELPEAEATFFTMHVLNSTRGDDRTETAVLFSRVHQIVEVVEDSFAARGLPPPDRKSADYARFVLHVKFMAQRIANGTMLEANDSGMFNVAANSYPESLILAKQVRQLVADKWHVDLSSEEMLYLIVHTERLASVSAGRMSGS